MRAPRRHPATAYLEELRRGKRRFPTTVKDDEAILQVESWLRAQAKVPPPARTSKPLPGSGPKAKPATKAASRPATKPHDLRRPSARKASKPAAPAA